MRTAIFPRSWNSSLAAPMFRWLLPAFILLAAAPFYLSQAQATLSVQGILKKANGDAVPDGSYNLTFKLYTQESGGSAIWTEAQTGVDVVSGIYSTILGNTSPLNVSFNEPYYLGVTVGSTEMTPRIQLTSAPYALSMIGATNQFPSSGLVLADSIKASGGILARGGAPGTNGVNRNGYAFTGNSGDKDSGLFSTTDGEVSLYVNNVELLEVKPGQATLNGDLILPTGGNLRYNTLDDWRLVETDYFENVNDAEGWKIYNPTSGPAGAWNNGSGSTASVTSFPGDFAGNGLSPTTQGQVFKKQFTLPGSSSPGTYTYVKVKFNYHYLNSWDGNNADIGWAGFSKTENCSTLRLGWFSAHTFYTSAGHNLGTTFAGATNYVDPNIYSEQWQTHEMVARYPSGGGNTSFWVVFGHASDEAPATENFAVGMIEVWVK